MKKIVVDKAVVLSVNQRERQFFKLRKLEIAEEEALAPIREEIEKKARTIFVRLLREYCDAPGTLLDELLPERGAHLLYPGFRRVSADDEPFAVCCMNAPPQLQDFIVTKALDRMLKSAVELPEEPRYRKDAEFLVYSALDDFYVRHGYSERFLALLWEELVVDALTTRNLAVVETDGEEE